jgi:hypothetical protein
MKRCAFANAKLVLVAEIGNLDFSVDNKARRRSRFQDSELMGWKVLLSRLNLHAGWAPGWQICLYTLFHHSLDLKYDLLRKGWSSVSFRQDGVDLLCKAG